MKKILIIGLVFPEPNSSAAGTRMLQIINLFQKNNYQITFASAASNSNYMFDLESIGVKKETIKLNDSSFNEFVKKLNPSIVIYDRFVTEEQFGWRVQENCPTAMQILDTEDLHFLRLARQLAFKEKREFEKTNLFSDTAKREIASILRCDLSLIISEFEIDLLKNDFKIQKSILHYLPLLVSKITSKSEEIVSWKKFTERENFIFIGNFLHEPNCNAVKYIKEDIWPKIHKQLPDAKMLIYGAYPSARILQLHNPAQNFHVLGRAHSALEVIGDARVMLVPMRIGAGIKGKLIEAIQCGTPSITTTIGAEGMHGNLPWNGAIANDSTDIANAAIAMYNDESLFKKSQKNGIEIINKRFEKSLFENDFIAKIHETQNNLSHHRQNNFMGEILKHHHLASTKYMSKWIEEKNKI